MTISICLTLVATISVFVVYEFVNFNQLCAEDILIPIQSIFEQNYIGLFSHYEKINHLSSVNTELQLRALNKSLNIVLKYLNRQNINPHTGFDEINLKDSDIQFN